jgi:Domain of unknown function (DUF4395)
VAASLLFFVFDAPTAGYVVLGVLTAAASLEAFVGFCLGGKVFALLMRAGIVPAEVCESCNDIWADRPLPTPGACPASAPGVERPHIATANHPRQLPAAPLG